MFMWVLENILIQNLLKENRECNKINCNVFWAEWKTYTNTSLWAANHKKKFTINYNLIVRYTYYLAVGITLHLNDK